MIPATTIRSRTQHRLAAASLAAAILAGWLLLTGCADGRSAPPSPTTAPATVTAAPLAAATASGTPTIMPPTPTSTATAVPPTPHPTWPPPITPEALLARTPPDAGQQAVAARLATTEPPQRDDIALARAYKGLNDGDLTPATPVTAPLVPGSIQTFNILNRDANTFSEVELVLRAVGQHAYFWFDTGPGSVDPDPIELAQIRDRFDQIYNDTVAIFGPEANPGIDGDPRIHVVNVSPLILCHVTLETRGSCGLAGYFGSADALPRLVDGRSNEREMFVMNAAHFGSDFYLSVLAHEFRHMIDDNYDRGDEDWVVEGSAMLAEALQGFLAGPLGRANLFLANPNQQLNSWSEDNPIPHYGQGYLFNQYLFNRLGPDGYRQFAQQPADGLRALDQTAAAMGLPLTGEQLWLDWLVALALHAHPARPAIYTLPPGLDTVTTTAVNLYPTQRETQLSQYAADYYTLVGSGPLTIRFTGSTLVPLLDTMPASGAHFWLAQRANYSQMRLTRELDLRPATAATLSYDVYYDIEQGYDFAYVSISTDGGQSWQGLTAPHMDGLDPSHNPSDSALTDRFYSSQDRTWRSERIDLTPYAGQQVQLRWEYVTDPILTYGGIAVDNIAVPEIGFYDDAESDQPGWQAEGFVRATAYIPQTWHLQLITFPGGQPVVESIPLLVGQRANLLVDLNGSAEPPLLIVAALAPQTLQPALYEVQFLGE